MKSVLLSVLTFSFFTCIDGVANPNYSKYCKIGYTQVREALKLSPNDGKRLVLKNCFDDDFFSKELKGERSHSGNIMYMDNLEDEKNYVACKIGVMLGFGSLSKPTENKLDDVDLITHCLNGKKETVSIRYLLPACQKGSAQACYNLGYVESEGNLEFAATTHFKLACDGGYIQGCNSFGVLQLKSGNKKEAMKLFKSACERGNASACENYNHATKESN